MGNPELDSGVSMDKIEYTLNRILVYYSKIHYRQFKHANQPRTHAFALGEETELPGKSPQSTGRTCKLNTHHRGRNLFSNPGGMKKMC